MTFKYLNINLFVSCILISFNLSAQDINDYYFQLSKASELTKKDKIDSAIIVYENAFKGMDYVHTRFLKRVLQLAEINKDQARITTYSNSINQQIKGTDQYLKNIIDSLLIEDQLYRDIKHNKAKNYYTACINDSNCNQTTKKFLKAKTLNHKWDEKDKSNIQYVLKLIEENGFLGEEKIGSSFNKFYMILLHFDADTNNKILLPILNSALKNGRILPVEYAHILDRHSFTQGNNQKYWIWPCSSKNEKLPFSEEDIPDIIKNREAIGIYNSKISQYHKRGYWILKNEYNQ